MTLPTLFDGTADHVTTTYTITDRVRTWVGPGKPDEIRDFVWWAYRCTCGHDVGLNRRALYSHESSAERMAWHHRHDLEPWLNPLPGPPI